MRYKYQMVVSIMNYFSKIPESGSKAYHICGIKRFSNLILMKNPAKSGAK